MRTFNIESQTANELDSCRDWKALRSDDRKIHARSKKISVLRRIKERMEKHYAINQEC